eukprot:scaffold10348_cov54-Attheya_sp.AAC.5
MSLTSENDDALKLRLSEWTEEQHVVASQVIVRDDPQLSDNMMTDQSSSGLGRFFNICKPLSQESFTKKLVFGGVDVSFPDREGDPAVAVYVVVDLEGQLIYQDEETFDLTIPYVSSYLSFREIDPLVRLVIKQQAEQPEVTPHIILVDGNGILHVRQAGIACFLGVRTGIPTIGVGKTLYCHDGLTKEMVHVGVEQRVRSLWRKMKEYNYSDTLLVQQEKNPIMIDKEDIDASTQMEDSTIQKEPLDTMNDTKAEEIQSMKEIMQNIYPLCDGFAVKLKGASGTVWGAALLGHGGRIGNGRQRTNGSGTINPIYISIGHDISLEEAIQVCASLSRARIPEPVRLADLNGRELMRKVAKVLKS